MKIYASVPLMFGKEAVYISFKKSSGPKAHTVVEMPGQSFLPGEAALIVDVRPGSSHSYFVNGVLKNQ